MRQMVADAGSGRTEEAHQDGAGPRSRMRKVEAIFPTPELIARSNQCAFSLQCHVATSTDLYASQYYKFADIDEID